MSRPFCTPNDHAYPLLTLARGRCYCPPEHSLSHPLRGHLRGKEQNNASFLEETQQEIVAEKGRQKLLLRQQQALTRYQQRVASLLLLLLPFLPSTPKAPLTPLLPVSSTATFPGSSRPSPHHPWKRGPACFPKSGTKK